MASIIEKLAAEKEAARQEANRAKNLEAARVLNQGDAGLARIAVEPYASGISQEDLYRLKLAQDAQFINQTRDNYNNSKQYVADDRLLKQVDWDTPEAYAAVVRTDKFNDGINQGLAAKWMADRAAFR